MSRRGCGCGTRPKVTMSMMTAMTTVLQRVLEIDWSGFPFSNVFIGSSRCCCLLHRVVRPCIGLCSEPFLEEKPRTFYSVNVFHVGLRVSLFVHAHLILLDLEVALHDRSAIVLLRGIQAISRSFEFVCFCRFSTTSTPVGIFQWYIVNSRDVHDESTADSLLSSSVIPV